MTQLERPTLWWYKSPREYFSILKGSSMFNFLSHYFKGSHFEESLHNACDHQWMAVNTRAPFFRMLSTLHYYDLLVFIWECFKQENLFHLIRSPRRILKRLLSRPRKTTKSKLVIKVPQSVYAPLLVIPPHRHTMFVPRCSVMSPIFALIPPEVLVYGHSPLVFFPRAGVG